MLWCDDVRVNGCRPISLYCRYVGITTSTLPKVATADEASVIEINAKVASACRRLGSRPHLLTTRPSHACCPFLPGCPEKTALRRPNCRVENAFKRRLYSLLHGRDNSIVDMLTKSSKNVSNSIYISNFASNLREKISNKVHVQIVHWVGAVLTHLAGVLM